MALLIAAAVFVAVSALFSRSNIANRSGRVRDWQRLDRAMGKAPRYFGYTSARRCAARQPDQ